MKKILDEFYLTLKINVLSKKDRKVYQNKFGKIM